MRGEWTAGVFLGANHSDSNSILLRQPGRDTELLLSPVHYEGKSFTGPLYYGGRIGCYFSAAPAFGLEGEFIHAKAYAKTDMPVVAAGRRNGLAVSGQLPLRSILQSFSVSHGLNFLLVNAVTRYPIARRTISLTARAGLGPALAHPESTVEGLRRERYQLSGLAFQLAAGTEIRLGPRAYAFAEYKLTRVHPELNVAAGTARTLFRSHHGIFGVGYRF